MELHLPFSFNFFLLIVPLLFLFYLKPFIQICKKLAGIGIEKKLPPGPWKLPLIGNLHQMVGSLPHCALKDLSKKHGPIFHLQLGEVSAIIVSSPQLAKEALTTHDLALANRPKTLVSEILFYNGIDVVFSPYGSHWRQMRKMCTSELLSVAKVRSLRSVREDEVHSFIESIRLSSPSPINLSSKLYVLHNVLVCKATYGNRCKDQDALIYLIMKIVSSVSGFDISDLFPSYKLLHILLGSSNKMRKMQQKLDKILEDIIKEHRDNLGGGEEDLLDVLLRLEESGGLTSSIIKAVTLDMLAGGTETASTVVEWAMVELLRNPRAMEKAQSELRQHVMGKNTVNESDIQDLSYLKMVIKETMRLHTPIPLLLPRQCREECELGGYTIPVNTHVIINAWAIARDSEYWHDAESFEPERFDGTFSSIKGTNFEYIPFGAGRRICPGISFGLANVEHTLAQLLYHFDWKLPNAMKPEDIDMTEKFGAAVKIKNNLLVVATPYSPL